MSSLRRLLVGLGAVLLVVLAIAAAPAFAALPACPVRPADDPTLTGAELELRSLRQEQADACEVTRAALSEPVTIEDTSPGGPLDVNCENCMSEGGASIATLSADDSGRLDLAWWGIWTVAGLMLVLLLVPAWEKAWRFWRE